MTDRIFFPFTDILILKFLLDVLILLQFPKYLNILYLFFTLIINNPLMIQKISYTHSPFQIQMNAACHFQDPTS